MRVSPPLRFLAAVLGGWAALRTALIAPPWPAPAADAAAVTTAARASGPAADLEREVGPRVVATQGRIDEAAPEPPVRAAQPRPRMSIIPTFQSPTPARKAIPVAAATAAVPALAAPRVAPPATPDRSHAPARRWSLSAWSFVRRGSSTALAAGGLLGGSQAGARLAYRLNRESARPLALSLRLSSPLQRTAAAEVALGIDWQPDPRLPVHFLAERRQALGREGRSAFAIAVHGGVGDAPLGPFRLDAYGQAGLVGVRSRDAFGDGSLRLSLPIGGRARLGAGAWAAAQPGLSRLDVGPQAALRLPVAGRAFTVAADWRVRVAGNASPGSGPTLTLGTDF